MTNQEPERIVDETPSSDRSSDSGADRNDTARLATADMAAAATASTRAKAVPEANQAKWWEDLSSKEGFEPLFDKGELDDFRSRWYAIQAAFVDEPRRSVEQADELVATVMQRLAAVFAAERENLEREWGTGDDVSTEDLRIALRRYRSFFDRLLSV